jgi:hypothetical protein
MPPDSARLVNSGVDPGSTQETAIAGLCATCEHVRRVTSDRGSVFFLCRLSQADPNFPKYPRLPVLTCSGYKFDSLQGNSTSQ